MLLQIKDSLGDQTAIVVNDVAITDSLGDFSTLTFTFVATEANRIGAEMMVPMTEITVPENQQIFRILTSNPISLGKYRRYSVTAIHIAHDLHRKYVTDKLNGTQSLDACMKFITNGTAFNYVIHDKFKNYAFSEGFGAGYSDELLTQNLASDFGFEYHFDNYTIHIYKHIGKNDAFIFIDGANCSKISVVEDYTGITTHIKGEGKHDDNDKPLVTAEYTSPLAQSAKWGPVDAEPIQDDTITDKNTLLNKLKATIKDYPDIQYTMDYVNFKKAIPGFDVNQIKVGNTGWLRDRFGIDVDTRIFSMTYYPQNTKNVGQITFGNKRFDPVKYSVELKKAHDDNAKLGSLLKLNVKQASQTASKAFNSRLTGMPVVNPKRMERDATLPAFTLMVPDDNAEMGLAKGQTFHVTTRTDLVEGLETFVDGKIPEIPEIPNYGLATSSENGLMSAGDKAKLDQLKIEPIPELLMTDKVDGSIYVITVEKGEIKLTKGGTKE
ncbi:phage tail protein [Latilactobacillus sakei]